MHRNRSRPSIPTRKRSSSSSSYDDDAVDARNRDPVLVGDPNEGLPPALEIDWISVLLHENRDRIENVSDSFQLFVCPEVVDYFFTICLRLRLSQECKYLAISIFNDFMISHVAGLYNIVYDLRKKTVDERIAEWEKIQSTISRQLPLRALACIQIASKLHSSDEAMTSKRVQRCLRNLGQPYTEDAVRKSELRVLATIGFCGRVRQSPLTYVESLLGLLVRRNPDLRLDAGQIWEYASLVLDCVFLQLKKVYQRLLLLIHGQASIKISRDRLLRIQSDYVLLAAGIVTTAVTCVHGMEYGDAVIPRLSDLTTVSRKDVQDTATAIMKAICEP